MKLSKIVVVATALSLAVAGCAVPMGPIEVTRFHLPDTSALGKGPIAVELARGDGRQFARMAIPSDRGNAS